MLNFLAQSYTYTTTSSNSDTDGAVAGFLAAMGIFIVVYLALIVLLFVSYWKVFQKAGRPGWAGLVPYHNYVLILEMAGKPGWWILMPLLVIPFSFIPLLGLIVTIPATIAIIVYYFIIMIAFAKAFGKGAGFGVLLVLLPIIGWPMLAFGSAVYSGPKFLMTSAPAHNPAPAAPTA